MSLTISGMVVAKLSGGFGTVEAQGSLLMQHHEVFEPLATDDSAEIVRNVQGELGNRIRHLQIVAQAEGLILRGRARTYYTKQLVQHAVMRLTSRRVLANEIEVN
jgi:hypothetical protein